MTQVKYGLLTPKPFEVIAIFYFKLCRLLTWLISVCYVECSNSKQRTEGPGRSKSNKGAQYRGEGIQQPNSIGHHGAWLRVGQEPNFKPVVVYVYMKYRHSCFKLKPSILYCVLQRKHLPAGAENSRAHSGWKWAEVCYEVVAIIGPEALWRPRV